MMDYVGQRESKDSTATMQHNQWNTPNSIDQETVVYFFTSKLEAFYEVVRIRDEKKDFISGGFKPVLAGSMILVFMQDVE